MYYRQAIDFLESLTDYEKAPAAVYQASNFDLRRVDLLLEKLGNPHLGRRTVHIAGTKGKGSTAAMISSILKAAGLKIGLYSSPHLFSWQERISVNGRSISQNELAEMAGLIRPLVISLNNEGRYGKLTTFEVLTAIAFMYFKAKNTVAQVLETGMGGRLDATNVAVPDVCVITSVSLDHTQVLGNSIEQIAAEKAGIIKKGCTVICAPQQFPAQQVIEAKCHEMQARLILCGKDLTWQLVRSDLNGQHFLLKGRLGDYDLRIPLLGDFQLENAALAIGAMETLIEQGVSISEKDIARGFSRVRWPARMQVLQKSPLLLIDGAHNMYSMHTVINSIRKHFNFSNVYVIFGASRDKDIAGIATVLARFARRIILARSGHPSAAGFEQLNEAFQDAGVRADPGRGVAECLTDVLTLATENDLILVTGSLFLAAEALEAYKKVHRFKTPPPTSDSGCARALH